MKKIKMSLIALFVCALGYVSYSTYDYMTMTDAERFLLANIEALTIEEPGGGGDCDIYKYNKNMREAWINHTITGSANVGTYITLPNGKRIRLDVEVDVSLPIQYPDCVESPDNCCIKTHIDRNIKYL